MSKHIIAMLKGKLDDLSPDVAPETRRNALKEELQFYVLDFIYHHPEYSAWIMYGGSSLRILHGLDRMSVDLDFEVSHAITEQFLEIFKKGIEHHFIENYGATSEFLTVKKNTKRGLTLKFHIGEELSFGHSSKQVHVTVDLNHFVAPKTVPERRPITRNQLSFVILTYNIATLMASKIAAIFLRGSRGVGKALYEEKGRDIYDLLWYMNKKVIPNLAYLVAKKIEVKDFGALFDQLTRHMHKVSDANLKQDLFPLFFNRRYVENWLAHWRESYQQLLDDYHIRTITTLEHIRIHQDFDTDHVHFLYVYGTQDGGDARVAYTISDRWMDHDLPIKMNELLEDKIVFSDDGKLRSTHQQRLKPFAALFYEKTERYFNSINRVAPRSLETKVIRMTSDRLNPKEQIVLSTKTLVSCELDDLFK